MYLHHPTEDDGNYQDLVYKELLVSESSPANSLKFLQSGQEEVLNFVKTGKSVSTAEYACWHRIVQEKLSCNENANHTIKIDFELAIVCFREIERVHRFSESSYLRKLD